MTDLMNWINGLCKNNPLGYAVFVVVVMAVIGSLIGLIMELFFKIIGVKSDKIEIQH